MSALQQTIDLIEQYIQTDQQQEQRLHQLLALSSELDETQKRQCIEALNRIGGPCNHYFDLSDAILSDEKT